MRILLVTAHYPPDFVSGATLQVARLARELRRAGDDVRVVSGSINAGLTDGATREEVVDGVDVCWIGTADRVEQDVEANWRNPAATELVAELVDAWRPTVLHAHALQTLGADLLAAAADRGVTTFLTMHDFWWWCPRLFLVDRQLVPCSERTLTSTCACATTAADRQARWRALAPLLGRVDQLLVPSRAFASVVTRNGIGPERIVIDENDVSDDIRAGSTAAPRTSDTVRFVYVGGDHPLKGRDVLLEACSLVRRGGWTLDLYGVQPPRRTFRLRHRHLRFHPPYDVGHTREVLERGDVLIIPSLARESFSIAAREGLACGLAVVTADCLGPLDVVVDGGNGLVVPTGRADALADAMTTLVDDPRLLASLRHSSYLHPPALRRPAEHARALRELYAEASPGPDEEAPGTGP